MDGRMNKQMNGRMKVPCVLQDFIPFGAAALLPPTPIHAKQSRATGIADHILPLGDLFCTSQASHILNQTFQTPNQAFQALNQASPTPNEALQTLNQTSDPYAWTQVFM